MVALLVWTQCGSIPGLGLDDERHYSLLSKWGHFFKTIIVARYQTEMLLSIKLVPLIMILGQPDCEEKLRQVVILPDDPYLFQLPVLLSGIFFFT